MKKRIFIGVLLICAFALGMFFFVPNERYYVYADESENLEEDIETEDPPVTEDDVNIEQQIYDDLMRGGYEIAVSTELEDSHLYSALLQIIKDYIKETYNYYYTGSSLYNTMFKSFTEIDVEDMGIVTLAGLEKFKFDELKSLKKPFIIVLNCKDPQNEKTLKLASEIETKVREIL